MKATIEQQEYIEKFMAVCDYINSHCTEELTLDDISAMAGFSKYHFSRLFKEFTNTSFRFQVSHLYVTSCGGWKH